MHKTARCILLATFLLLPQGTGTQAAAQSATVTVRNDSSGDALLQVRDDACSTPREIACSDARVRLQDRECLDDPSAAPCVQARETFDSACGCLQAQDILASSACRQGSVSQECVDARVKAESASCIDGLVYEGLLRAGGEVRLVLCATPSGYAGVSVRDIRKGAIWKNYRLVSDGETIRHP